MSSPDPRLSKDADLFVYEPRTKDATAHYDRDEIVADLESFYSFLPHVSTSMVHLAPPGGWPEITQERLAAHDIHKSPEAIDLLRHLPYISSKEPWIMITALACDYRDVNLSPEAPEKPGWFSNAAGKEWPTWTVQLTAGTDREGHHYILDTTDGTISRYCATSHGQYPPTYPQGDPRSWRDQYTDPETVTLKEWLKYWKGEYLKMTVLTVPPDYDGYGSPETRFGQLDAQPDSFNYEEMHVSQHIACQKLVPRYVVVVSFDDRNNDVCRKCVRYTANMVGLTWRTTRKKHVSKHSRCGTKTSTRVK